MNLYTLAIGLFTYIFFLPLSSYANEDADDSSFKESYFDCPCPHLMAHRGASGNYPESTKLAFKKAIRFQTDILELDVHLSKDGEIIVSHDASLLRTTGQDIEIKDTKSNKIKNFDAGYMFSKKEGVFPFRGKKIKMLTLKNLMEAFPNARFNIEIKPNSEKLAIKLSRYINKLGINKRVVVGSKHTEALEVFRNHKNQKTLTSAHLSDIVRAYISWVFNLDIKDAPYQILQLPYNFVNQSLVEYFHKQNKTVHVWTVNEPEDIKHMLLIKVDGVMTNYPELAYPIFVELGLR